MKRRANVPPYAAGLGNRVSKADLLEAAWHLAALANDAGSADDGRSTFRRLVEEINANRVARGERPITPVDIEHASNTVGCL